MEWIDNILFLGITVFALGAFARQLRAIWANIGLGRPENRTDRPADRLSQMLLVAFGQKKMFKNLRPAVLHLIVYIGFLVINIEVLEILIDGIFGTHRVLGFLGPLYGLLMGVNEMLGVLVIVACVIFLYRRNVMKVKRFEGIEMKQGNYVDANIILYTEIALMMALYLFNMADTRLSELGVGAYETHKVAGWFPVSNIFNNILGSQPSVLVAIKNIGWWVHVLGIYAFLNYLPRSKHFHIIMAFPNTYYARLAPLGKFNSMEQVYHEVKAAFDPTYQVPATENAVMRFGAKDVNDLSWKNLMDSYACTECGRCTSVCPANLTGKRLSPRKIIMDTRDRLEEIQKNKLAVDADTGLFMSVNGASEAAAHTLLGENYITSEELRACTTCNACTDACPVNIDHVSTILDLRRFLAMELSDVPEAWGRMFTNIENNGAPWAVAAASRYDWAMDVYMPEN